MPIHYYTRKSYLSLLMSDFLPKNIFYYHKFLLYNYHYPCLQRRFLVGIFHVFLKLNMSAKPSRQLFLGFQQHFNLFRNKKRGYYTKGIRCEF